MRKQRKQRFWVVEVPGREFYRARTWGKAKLVAQMWREAGFRARMSWRYA